MRDRWERRLRPRDRARDFAMTLGRLAARQTILPGERHVRDAHFIGVFGEDLKAPRRSVDESSAPGRVEMA